MLITGQPGIIWAARAIWHRRLSLQGQFWYPCDILYPTDKLSCRLLGHARRVISAPRCGRKPGQLLHVLGLGLDLDLFRKRVEAGIGRRIVSDRQRAGTFATSDPHLRTITMASCVATRQGRKAPSGHGNRRAICQSQKPTSKSLQRPSHAKPTGKCRNALPCWLLDDRLCFLHLNLGLPAI